MALESEFDSCASTACGCNPGLTRRDFIRWSSLATAALSFRSWRAVAGPFTAEDFAKLIPAEKKLDPAWVKSLYERGEPSVYRGSDLEKIGMPIGGICAGQLYLGGDGRLWHWDIFNVPQPANFSDTGGPNYARPPKPASPIAQGFAIKTTANGQTQTRILDSRGIDPQHIAFRGQYPVGTVEYSDPASPVRVELEAFSPFIPLNVPDSSLPATVLRFTVRNLGAGPVAVELGGWLENAVCLGSARPGLGQRRNRAWQDGQLTLVEGTAEPLPAGSQPPPRPEIVFETFENGYGEWKVQGDAFGQEPAKGTLPGQQRVSGFAGQALVNTFRNGDSTRGRLTSPEFKIERKYIGFLIGGGSHAQKTCMNLVVGDRPVRSATGHNDERLDWQEWDVAELEGQTAHLEIVDESTEGWGHVNVDQILFTDTPPSARRPLQEREDFGSMTLAILGPSENTFTQAQLPAATPDALFEAPGTSSAESATVPFGQTLVGGVSRKLTLPAGGHGEVVFVLSWYFPGILRSVFGPLESLEKLQRAYVVRFKSAAEVARYVAGNFERLAGQTKLWNETWYDSSLPYWFLDRTFAPICTLATSTCYQFNTGRFYAFEGVYCCQGTCQHVWNYAQSVARIFPELERDLRQRTDFGTAWHENGAIDYRGECARHVAHDGQCGVILRAWREHQMSADGQYLRRTWPRIRKSLEYLISLDGAEDGLLEGEQYNTLDAAWFGPMAWISSFYIAALRAGEAMALEQGDQTFANRCRQIAERGSRALVSELYNGEYFIHKPDPKHPKATNTNQGCHIDQLMGQAWALQVALPRVVDPKETRAALEAIWKYNFTSDVGPYRKLSVIKGGRWYAMPGEGGVVMTTFPRGGIEQATGNGGFGYYFNEVWTGQEHQLAAHMMWEGMLDEALVITRFVHDRHHPAHRNPYNEIECSDHYTRAMSSHGTFLAACGYEYHGPNGHLGFAPRLHPEAFKAPFTVAEGWGTFEQTRNASEQRHRLSLRYGRLRLKTLSLQSADGETANEIAVELNGSALAATLQASGRRAVITLANDTVMKAGDHLEVRMGTRAA